MSTIWIIALALSVVFVVAFGWLYFKARKKVFNHRVVEEVCRLYSLDCEFQKNAVVISRKKGESFLFRKVYTSTDALLDDYPLDRK